MLILVIFVGLVASLDVLLAFLVIVFVIIVLVRVVIFFLRESSVFGVLGVK